MSRDARTELLFSPPPILNIALFAFLQSAPICQVEIISVDADTGERIATRVCDFTGNNVTFTVAKLTTNHHYNFSITASNAAGTATSVHQISTYYNYYYYDAYLLYKIVPT